MLGDPGDRAEVEAFNQEEELDKFFGLILHGPNSLLSKVPEAHLVSFFTKQKTKIYKIETDTSKYIGKIYRNASEIDGKLELG
jgi:hypothetical protein